MHFENECPYFIITVKHKQQSNLFCNSQRDKFKSNGLNLFIKIKKIGSGKKIGIENFSSWKNLNRIEKNQKKNQNQNKTQKKQTKKKTVIWTSLIVIV